MLRSVSERYVEDQVRRYPSLTRSYFIKSERKEFLILSLLMLTTYGVAMAIMWYLSGREYAIGAGSAYLGFFTAMVWERLGRIAAFKRLMPKEH